MRVNREDDGGRVRAQRVMERHKKNTRVRDRQLCESVGHFSETPSVLPSKDYKLMFPPPRPAFSEHNSHWDSRVLVLEKCLPQSCVCVCVGVETIKSSLAAQHTRNTAKHDWNRISGKVHVSDANPKSENRTCVCVCVMIMDPLMTTLLSLSLSLSPISWWLKFLISFFFSFSFSCKVLSKCSEHINQDLIKKANNSSINHVNAGSCSLITGSVFV